jgi:hypothetical protein
LNPRPRAGNLRTMKFLSALLMTLCLASGASTAQAASINGQNYVSLADWAGANGLKTFWLRRGEEIAATNRTMRLVFDKDSNTAEINGVRVALSFPVAVDKGAPFITQFDLDNTVRPLLYPARYLDPKRITTICLDPGHGGKDSGNRVGGFFWHNEKTYTLLLAQELHDQLRRAGFELLRRRKCPPSSEGGYQSSCRHHPKPDQPSAHHSVGELIGPTPRAETTFASVAAWEPGLLTMMPRPVSIRCRIRWC